MRAVPQLAVITIRLPEVSFPHQTNVSRPFCKAAPSLFLPTIPALNIPSNII